MDRMRRTTALSRAVAWTLAVTILFFGWYPPEAQAMLAPAGLASADSGAGSQRTADLMTVQRVLEAKVVQQRLADLGLTVEEINARLAGLSDDQLHQLASRIDAMVPGGDTALGFLLALVVVGLIVLILYLTGHKIIITKTEPKAESKAE